MSVIRMERNGNFTVMANYHFRDKRLSFKEMGLLSFMYSLPGNWKYSIEGLASLTRDGSAAVQSGISKLEQFGYIRRKQHRHKDGTLGLMEYVVYEVPQNQPPKNPCPQMEAAPEPPQNIPSGENRPTVKPETFLGEKSKKFTPPKAEKPSSGNRQTVPYISNTKKLNTYGERFPSPKTPSPPPGKGNGGAPEGKEGRENKRTQKSAKTGSGMEECRAIIRRNTGGGLLSARSSPELDELLEIAAETLFASENKATIRISGINYPASVVKERFLSLDDVHVDFVLDCMSRNTTPIKNIRQYLTATLFNAPVTINSYYTARVNHDFRRQPP